MFLFLSFKEMEPKSHQQIHPTRNLWENGKTKQLYVYSIKVERGVENVVHYYSPSCGLRAYLDLIVATFPMSYRGRSLLFKFFLLIQPASTAVGREKKKRLGNYYFKRKRHCCVRR